MTEPVKAFLLPINLDKNKYDYNISNGGYKKTFVKYEKGFYACQFTKCSLDFSMVCAGKVLALA